MFLINNSVHYYLDNITDDNQPLEIPPCGKGNLGGRLAIFDMDDTIIRTKSSKKFPLDKDDWQFWHKEVPKKLQKLYMDNYKIIIVTNQAGITKGKTNLNDIIEKFKNIKNKVNIPMDIYICSDNDNYRKPMTDVWDFILKNNNLKNYDIIDNADITTIKTVSKKTFYCGDAVGRKGDFSATDRLFAENAGIRFYTPEEIFLEDFNKEKYKNTYKNIKLKEHLSDNDYPIFSDIIKKNIIINVGAQASGKSTISKINKYKDYIILNNDTMKSKKKLEKTFNEIIEKGGNIIIDNTNPKSETRKYYIDIAKKNGYIVYCYFFDFDKLFIKHMNCLRVQCNHGKEKHIPDIAYNIFYKNLEIPKQSENIDEIIIIDKLYKSPNKNNEFDKYYWNSYF